MGPQLAFVGRAGGVDAVDLVRGHRRADAAQPVPIDLAADFPGADLALVVEHQVLGPLGVDLRRHGARPLPGLEDRAHDAQVLSAQLRDQGVVLREGAHARVGEVVRVAAEDQAHPVRARALDGGDDALVVVEALEDALVDGEAEAQAALALGAQRGLQAVLEEHLLPGQGDRGQGRVEGPGAGRAALLGVGRGHERLGSFRGLAGLGARLVEGGPVRGALAQALLEEPVLGDGELLVEEDRVPVGVAGPALVGPDRGEPVLRHGPGQAQGGGGELLPG